MNITELKDAEYTISLNENQLKILCNILGNLTSTQARELNDEGEYKVPFESVHCELYFMISDIFDPFY